MLGFFLRHLGSINIEDATKKDIERVLGEMNSTEHCVYLWARFSNLT